MPAEGHGGSFPPIGTDNVTDNMIMLNTDRACCGSGAWLSLCLQPADNSDITGYDMRRPYRLTLSAEQEEYIEKICRDTGLPKEVRRRAWIILYKACGFTSSDIGQMMGVTRLVVDRWLRRYREDGWDKFCTEIYNRNGRKSRYTEEEKAWILRIASTDPRQLGCSFDKWTHSALTSYISSHAVPSGYGNLKDVSHGIVARLVRTNNKESIKKHP